MALDIGSFLGGHVGPVPVWLIVGVGGVGAAFLLPKLFGGFGSSNSTAAATDTGAPTDSTGLPPAPAGGPPGNPPAPPGGPTGPNQPTTNRAPAQPVKPAGPSAPGVGPANEPPRSGPTGPTQPVAGRAPTKPTGPNQPVPGARPKPTGPNQPLPGRPAPTGPNQPVHHYVHPSAWPSNGSTLSGIAAIHGLPVSRLESLNGWIHQERGTWDELYPADEIRIA